MVEDVFGIVGSVIAGSYQIERVVAEGGFGVVYRAYHGGFRAPVALKCLKIPQQLSAAHKDDFLEQFRAEAELLFRLSASIPAVVRPLHVDAVTLESGAFVPFIALEWLEGETLDSVMERRKAQGQAPLQLKKLIRMLTPVARALERAHNFMGPEGPISVVHRDLKPENIFVANMAGEEVVKILDFGIGKAKSVASQVAGRASQTGSAFSSFTPAYGAPEQWVPKRYGQTGPWTDVWGLALTVVELMVARTVIDGDQAAMLGTVLDENRRPTPRNEGIAVSDAVEEVFRRALAVDPRNRYAEAGQFWDELVAAAGARAEVSEVSGHRVRDNRAEGGHIPLEEHVGPAAKLASRPPLRPDRALATPSAPTLPAPVASTPAAIVPELELAAPSPAPRPRTASGASHQALLDLDDAPPLDLALDLQPGEAPSMRAPARTSGTYAAVGNPGRTPSGANLIAAGRTPSGATPAVRLGAHASGTSFPAVFAADPAAGPGNGESSTRPASDGGSGRPEPLSAPRWSMPAPPPEHAELRALSPPESSLIRRLIPGIALITVSIILTLTDQIYAGSAGEVLTIASLRATWIAGLLLVSGLGAVAWAVIRQLRG
ncbi:MAG: protein kinase [Polyangiaceae bacterium]|nr:protein kinase [Polyangiaceae bacterium]